MGQAQASIGSRHKLFVQEPDRSHSSSPHLLSCCAQIVIDSFRDFEELLVLDDAGSLRLLLSHALLQVGQVLYNTFLVAAQVEHRLSLGGVANLNQG